VCGGAEDTDAPRRVFDHSEDVQASADRGSCLEEVTCEQRFGLAGMAGDFTQYGKMRAIYR
jgi:hypothetical protein